MVIDREEVKSKKILVYGDYILDQYIFGTVDRISPEAPIPVLKMKNKEYRLGGAGNLINNIIALGAQVKAIGCLGNDKFGNIIKNKLDEIKVDTNYIYQYENINTIIKSRYGTEKQYFIRVDEEDEITIPQEYISLVEKNLTKIFNDIDIFVVSDYGKGSVDEELLSILLKYCKNNKIISIVDPKGDNYNKYFGCTFCTPNLQELKKAVNNDINSEEDIKNKSVELCQKCNIENIILTRSEDGISSISKFGDKKDFPIQKKEVIDVSGAGDTVVAMFSIMQAMNFSIEDSCIFSNIAASVVCSKKGTAVCYFEEVFGSLEKNKIVSIQKLKLILNKLKKDNKIVFTNGCFDLLHIGHIDSFNQAKKFGDILIVAVNSDASIKRIKGNDRPIINENARAKMVASLEVVDYVVIMDDDNPIRIIEEVKPDISVKGEDWKNKFIPEKEIVEKYGGEMKFIKFENDISTTKILERVKNRE